VGAAKPLRIGFEPNNPPWTFLVDQLQGFDTDPAGVRTAPPPTAQQLAGPGFVGLDVDVAKALSAHLGRPIEWVRCNWYQLEKQLLEGRFDVILNAWTPTRQTPATIVASAPYANWGLLVVVRSEDEQIRSYKDLAKKRVGHIADPAVLVTLSSLGAELRPYETERALLYDLRDKRLDAAVADSPFVRWRAANDPGLRIVGEPLNRLGYHVGLRRQDAQLFQEIQAALKAMAQAGELEAIRKKWEAGGK